VRAPAEVDWQLLASYTGEHVHLRESSDVYLVVS
jgi:hypothetical protein